MINNKVDKNNLFFKELDGAFKSLKVDRISIQGDYSLYVSDRMRRYVESDTDLPNSLKEENACNHVHNYFPRPTKYYSDIIEEEETVKKDLFGKVTEYYFLEENDKILHSIEPFEKEWLVLEILHDKNIRSDRNALKIRYQNTLIGWISKYDYENSLKISDIINKFSFDDFTELKPSVFMIYDGEQYFLVDKDNQTSEEEDFQEKEIIDDEGYQNSVQNRSYKSTTSIANSLGMESYELFLMLLEHKLIDKPFYTSKRGIGRRGSMLHSEEMVKRYYNKNYNLTEQGIKIGGKYNRRVVDIYTLGITDEFDPNGNQWVVWDEDAIEIIKALVLGN